MKGLSCIGVLALWGCGPTQADEVEVLEAALVAGSADLHAERLCLRPTLVERVNADDVHRWAYMGAPTPPGFSTVETPRHDDGYQYAKKPVPESLAKRWPVSGIEKDLCFKATIPTIVGDRALVSLTIEEVREVFPRANYWLRHIDGVWRVSVKNNDHQDI